MLCYNWSGLWKALGEHSLFLQKGADDGTNYVKTMLSVIIWDALDPTVCIHFDESLSIVAALIFG